MIDITQETLIPVREALRRLPPRPNDKYLPARAGAEPGALHGSGVQARSGQSAQQHQPAIRMTQIVCGLGGSRVCGDLQEAQRNAMVHAREDRGRSDEASTPRRQTARLQGALDRGDGHRLVDEHRTRLLRVDSLWRKNAPQTVVIGNSMKLRT